MNKLKLIELIKSNKLDEAVAMIEKSYYEEQAKKTGGSNLKKRLSAINQYIKGAKVNSIYDGAIEYNNNYYITNGNSFVRFTQIEGVTMVSNLKNINIQIIANFDNVLNDFDRSTLKSLNLKELENHIKLKSAENNIKRTSKFEVLCKSGCLLKLNDTFYNPILFLDTIKCIGYNVKIETGRNHNYDGKYEVVRCFSNENDIDGICILPLHVESDKELDYININDFIIE